MAKARYLYRQAVIVWHDAVEHSDGSGAPRHRPAEQTAIGWILRHDDEGISFAGEYNQKDGTWRNENFIPGGMIIKVTRL